MDDIADEAFAHEDGSHNLTEVRNSRINHFFQKNGDVQLGVEFQQSIIEPRQRSGSRQETSGERALRIAQEIVKKGNQTPRDQIDNRLDLYNISA